MSLVIILLNNFQPIPFEFHNRLAHLSIILVLQIALLLRLSILQQNQMIDYRSKLLGYSPKPTQRLDEWTLINQHKSLEEEKAKLQEQRLEQQKRKTLKQQLDQQVRERNSKELALKNEEQYYGEIAARQVREAQMETQRKRREQIEKRKQMEEHNKHLFNGIVQSNFKEALPVASTSIDIGTTTQAERRVMLEHQRRGMIDELDRQIHQKEQQKMDLKKDEYRNDQANLSFQLNRFDVRDQALHSRYYGQNPNVYQYYQHIKEREWEKEREFEKMQVEEAGKRKQAEELTRINEKNINKQYLNTKMKEVLEQQMKINGQRKLEEERINPEEITYGTIGRMLAQHRHQPNKQQYFQDLKRQIEDKQKRQEAAKFMNEEEYKINLNQLNRAIEGSYTNRGYVDRSIHTLSDSHKVNVSLIDAHLEDRPEAEIARRNLQELKARNRQRLSLSLSDRPPLNNF